MLEEYAPPIPVARLLGCNGFGDAVGSVEAAASNDIQEIRFLGICLIWNNAAVKCLLESDLTYGNLLRGNPR